MVSMMKLLPSIYTFIEKAIAFDTIFAIYGPLCSKTVIINNINMLG